MSQALPPNLINISIPDLNEALSQGLDLTTEDSLLTFWKLYEASTTFIDDPVAVRSRNLFWRLLSSPQKAKDIDNQQLAALWWRCQVNDALVPIQLPERFLRSQQVSESSSSSVYPSETGDDDELPSRARVLPSRAEPSTGSRAGKRRSIGSASSYERSDASPRTSASAVTNNSSRPSLRRNTSSRVRTPTVASSGRGRAKPALPRRRSSQTRSQPLPPQVSPRPALRSPNFGGPAPPSGLREERPREIPVPSSGATFALPSASSWQSVDETLEQPSIASSGAGAPKMSLVDRDFRRNFVDTHRQMSSASNLEAMGRGRKSGSIVRFEEVPEVIGKGKGVALSAEDSPEALPARGRSDSQVISDSEDSEGVVMPRVQSNLSKLIKDERKQSGGRQLPPPQRLRPEGQSASSRRKDEEILEMGRKAGAPLIPKGRPGSDVAERMRSPSPGATF